MIVFTFSQNCRMEVDHRYIAETFKKKATFTEEDSAVVSESQNYLQKETLKVFNKKLFCEIVVKNRLS